MGDPSGTRRPLLFSSPRVVTTANALETATRHAVRVSILLARHYAGDWGAVTAHEAAQNEAVLAVHGAGGGTGTLLSDFSLTDDPQGDHLWVVTQLGEDGATSVLRPDEYDRPSTGG